MKNNEEIFNLARSCTDKVRIVFGIRQRRREIRYSKEYGDDSGSGVSSILSLVSG